MQYKTIDLCAGIGGIRRGFEKTGAFLNILSAEIDKFSCMTYEKIFGENPYNNVTSEEFKNKTELTDYDVLLAGFPCQTFSRAGLQEGFLNEEKGIIFSHIKDIIKRTRPKAFLLENVDHLTTHDKGRSFEYIINSLESELNYKIIGVTREGNKLRYIPKEFIRNSKDFGVPQNRPRVYIIGFNRELYGERADLLPNVLPTGKENPLYGDLNNILEPKVPPRYYLASGYLLTLENHKARQKKNGNGFGYKIVNAPGVVNPISSTLLASGGSGKERNLVYQPVPEYYGLNIKGKKTPLSDKGIRVMTPVEWGKLQGFINYGFIDEKGNDTFEFPKELTDIQKYKQFGNSVTIPVIEEMAHFMASCLEMLNQK